MVNSVEARVSAYSSSLPLKIDENPPFFFFVPPPSFAFAFLFTILLFYLAHKVMSGLATSVGIEDPEPRMASKDASRKDQAEEARQGRRNSIAASRRTSLV